MVEAIKLDFSDPTTPCSGLIPIKAFDHSFFSPKIMRKNLLDDEMKIDTDVTENYSSAAATTNTVKTKRKNNKS